MRDDKDRSGKWLLTSRADSLLRLAGLTGFTSWRAVQAELTVPKRTPDGLVELTFPDQTTVPALIEISTYPHRESAEQVARDAMLVYLDRGVWPEAFTFVLQPKGTFRLRGDFELASPRDTCGFRLRWRVVEMWTLEARDLLDSGDVGLVPWVPLTHLPDDPVPTLRECGERIEREAKPRDAEFMLNVLRLFTRFVYNRGVEETALGGPDMLPLPEHVLLEMPFIREIVERSENEAERRTTRQIILEALRDRFGEVPPDLDAQLAAVESNDRLRRLVAESFRAADVAAFRRTLLGGPNP